MPAVNYPQYLDGLKKQGIVYAKLVGEFEREFYVGEVGMARAAVGEFIRTAKTLAKGKGKAIKRARLLAKDGQENRDI